MTPAQYYPAPPLKSSQSQPNSQHVIGAYYPSWQIYRDRKPSDLRLSVLTHVYYAFANIGEDGTVCVSLVWPITILFHR
jgi:GH18 family chitinase